jgi:hypothetical protein
MTLKRCPSLKDQRRHEQNTAGVCFKLGLSFIVHYYTTPAVNRLAGGATAVEQC